MRKTRKPLITAMCALVLALGVNATYAWLTDDATVTNTFTVGKVEIALDEADVNEYGQKLNAAGEVAEEGDALAERVTGNSYKLIPGCTYAKDPIVTVVAGSEKCYVFVKVANGISELEVAVDDTTDEIEAIAEQIAANEWEALGGEVGVYYKIVDARDASEDLKLSVFESFTIDENKTAGNLQDITSDTSVTVKAFAVQFEGNADVAAAWKKIPDDNKK